MVMWDGVERRTQDRDLWAMLDPIESRVTMIAERQCMTDEEVFVLRQHCMECLSRRRPAFPVILWALALGALALGALAVLVTVLT